MNEDQKEPVIKSVLLGDNPRRYIREALSAGTLKAAIVPIGSTEQHNEHLAMTHDAASVSHVTRLAAEQLFPKVIVTPTLSIGIAEHWMHHKGTLTVRAEIFSELLFDVCESLARHGIEHVLIVNGHAGNIRTVRERLEDFQSRLGIDLQFCSYWEAYTREFADEVMESKSMPGHAAEFETAFALAAFPQNVDWDGVDYDAAELRYSSDRDEEQDRQFHEEAKLATAAKGQRFIDVAVTGLVERLAAMISAS